MSVEGLEYHLLIDNKEQQFLPILLHHPGPSGGETATVKPCQHLVGELVTSHPACDTPQGFAITPEGLPWKGLGRGAGDMGTLGSERPCGG